MKAFQNHHPNQTQSAPMPRILNINWDKKLLQVRQRNWKINIMTYATWREEHINRTWHFMCWSALRKLKIYLHSLSFLDAEGGRGSKNLSSRETRTNVSYTVNTMAAYGLATQGARASAAMILTEFVCNISASAGLMTVKHWTSWHQSNSFCVHAQGKEIKIYIHQWE